MSNRSDDSWVGVVILVLAGLCAYGVWQFSNTFGLDMATGFSVIGRLVVFAVLAGAALYSSNSYSWDMFRLGNTWPLLLGVFWVCWWPALDFWAAKEIPSFMNPESASVWWDAWYTKWGGLVGIVGIGYLVKKMLDD
ncbi:MULTISPECIES: hypothetical protein [Betaproteobacteria]|jgi:hypothetical protein|uniref:hypothetical protein n=1 Tax=Betaproteobacteria TaxID=28216 RepID=UPI0011D5ADC1|nr:hypothetical protein [Cupriavidus metallidurans]TXH36401.1 MAG: hypothetical protein E6Q92_11315 [Burkholderiaceae bacterium]HMW86491.1 hypothetical protein [Nitrospira sp.]HNF61935.1 hypothetical protein [Rhodocyclaceae bacterium]MDE4922981.1 hypothetical protein [Cupriavidus metallidurans]HNE32876.1 hypothetical protein [Nitrospira sp.]